MPSKRRTRSVNTAKQERIWFTKYHIWRYFQFRYEFVKDCENIGLIKPQLVDGELKYHRDDLNNLRTALNAALGVIVDPSAQQKLLKD